jgi:hypothetical protein
MNELTKHVFMIAVNIQLAVIIIFLERISGKKH